MKPSRHTNVITTTLCTYMCHWAHKTLCHRCRRCCIRYHQTHCHLSPGKIAGELITKPYNTKPRIPHNCAIVFPHIFPFKNKRNQIIGVSSCIFPWRQQMCEMEVSEAPDFPSVGGRKGVKMRMSRKKRKRREEGRDLSQVIIISQEKENRRKISPHLLLILIQLYGGAKPRLRIWGRDLLFAVSGSPFSHIYFWIFFLARNLIPCRTRRCLTLFPSPLILKAIPPSLVPSYLHTSIQSRRRSHFRIPAKGAGFANSTNFRFPLSFFGIICDIPEGVFIDACFYLVNRIPVHQFPFIAWLSTQNTQRGSDGGRRG